MNDNRYQISYSSCDTANGAANLNRITFMLLEGFEYSRRADLHSYDEPNTWNIPNLSNG